MDIKVGSVLPVKNAEGSNRGRSHVIEARVLAVREPRRRPQRRLPGDAEQRRQPSRETDPVNGRVLVLMVPDSRMLPADFDKNGYRVFLRFARA